MWAKGVCQQTEVSLLQRHEDLDLNMCQAFSVGAFVFNAFLEAYFNTLSEENALPKRAAFAIRDEHYASQDGFERSPVF